MGWVVYVKLLFLKELFNISVLSYINHYLQNINKYPPKTKYNV